MLTENTENNDSNIEVETTSEENCSQKEEQIFVDTLDADVNKQIQSLLELNEKLTKEHAEMQKRCVYSAAEVENVRKRANKEKEDGIRYAITKFARELLSVADNLQRALDTIMLQSSDSTESNNAIVEGIKLVEKEFVSILEKHGIQKISTSIGDTPNPDFHEILSEADDANVEPGQICMIIQDGYMITDRLLRPALVIVRKK